MLNTHLCLTKDHLSSVSPATAGSHNASDFAPLECPYTGTGEALQNALRDADGRKHNKLILLFMHLIYILS